MICRKCFEASPSPQDWSFCFIQKLKKRGSRTLTHFIVSLHAHFVPKEIIITSDKRELGRIYKKGCRCGKRRRVKLEDMTVAYTRWSEGRGYLRRGKWIGDERFGSGRGEYVDVSMCVWNYGSVIDVKVDTQDCDIMTLTSMLPGILPMLVSVLLMLPVALASMLPTLDLSASRKPCRGNGTGHALVYGISQLRTAIMCEAVRRKRVVVLLFDTEKTLFFRVLGWGLFRWN